MTQVKLWQIVSQSANAIIFSDADGNLKSLPASTSNQVLVSGPDGAPMWAENTALVAALQAQTDAGSALAAAKAYTEAQIAALVDNAPVALNTLNELAQKLNGEDSAINALLLQVDGKAEKTAVATLVAQTKQDTMADCKAYTDSTIGTVVSGIAAQIGQAKSDAISAAATDASFKATNAQANAIQAANGYTDQVLGQASNAAMSEITAKSEAAKTSAINEAKAYTDSSVSGALTSAATDAQSKASAAKTEAIDAAASDATAKMDALRTSIPGTFWTEGTSTACFLASAQNLDMQEAIGQGILVTNRFTEITGAAVVANDPSLNAKLLFVNGVAASDEWSSQKVGNGQLLIKLSPQLAQHVFNGEQNALMLLAEYKSYNRISQIS